MKLSAIKTNPNNPRVVKDAKFAKAVNSLLCFPKMLPKRKMIIDRQGNNITLGGNVRFRSIEYIVKLSAADFDELCRSAGAKDDAIAVWEQVRKTKSIPDEWVDNADEFTEEEKQRFIIADNVGFGEWDWDTLANEWDAGDLEAWGLDVPVFDEERQGVQEDNYEEPESIKTDIVSGDIFQIGKHRLLCGDSTINENIEKIAQGENIGIIFTDPDYSMDDDALFSCYANTLQLNAKASLWVCADKQAVKLAMNDFDNFSSFFIHDFKVPTLISNTRAMQRHNMIVCFGNCAIKNRQDGFTTIVPIATERTLESHKVFRMAKRVGLPATFIEHFTDAGDIIVDIFAHSGSTIVAAQQLNRICYAIEIDPRYCYLMIDRMQKAFPGIEIKRNGEPYVQQPLNSD